MPTRISVQRGLLARVPGLAGVWIEPGPVSVIHLVPEPQVDRKRLLADANAALGELVAFPTAAELRVTEDASRAEGTGLIGVGRFAALTSSPTEDGIREGLVKLVPSIGRLVVQPGLGTVRVLVADENNASPPEFLAKVTEAMNALGALGARYEVAQLQPSDTRNALQEVHFYIPTRDRRLDKLREDDEARFERRLRLLAENDDCETVPLIDNLKGERIFTTIGPKEGPIGAFLPIYDHILLMMAPGHHEGDDYYVRNYGLSEQALFEYVRAGKIVPVFKFELGVYPEVVWRRFTEDLSLQWVSARDVDYACARYAWSSSEWLRVLRKDRRASQELFAQLRTLGRASKEARLLGAIIRSMLHGAEAFEGEFWRRGHLAAALYSPAMPLAEAIQQGTPLLSNSMAPIEVNGAAMHISMGLALGAATYEGLVQNERLLLAVAERFRDSSEVVSASKGAEVKRVLDALALSYSNDIPPKEYIAIVDEANARRIREIVATLTQGHTIDGGDEELRERIRSYNHGVDTMMGKELSSGEITAVTALAATAFGVGWLKALGVGITTKLAEKAMASADSTKAGDALDWMRGKLHGLPKETIRLYKIRSRLEKTRRNG